VRAVFAAVRALGLSGNARSLPPLQTRKVERDLGARQHKVPQPYSHADEIACSLKGLRDDGQWSGRSYALRVKVATVFEVVLAAQAAR
jgi:hypothetical protein